MDQGSSFLIYRSSAGSGKTYNLAREYLKLALLKPGNFRHILAVTFTNKATREMKSRIITELYNLSTPENSSPMMNDLMEQTGLNSLQLQERSLHALRSILHDFSHFSVSTIDSFFQRVIQGFAREIGLQGGYEVELDTQKVLGEVTDLIFLELDENKKLLDWLFRFTMDKMEDEKGWDIRKEIIGLGEEIFRESFSQIGEKLRSVNADSDITSRLRDELSARKFSFEKEMKKLATEALEIIRQNGLAVEDFSYGKSGVAGYFPGIINNRKYEYGKRVADALENTGAWTTKSSPRKEDIIALAENQLIREAEGSDRSFRQI